MSQVELIDGFFLFSGTILEEVVASVQLTVTCNENNKNKPLTKVPDAMKQLRKQTTTFQLNRIE